MKITQIEPSRVAKGYVGFWADTYNGQRCLMVTAAGLAFLKSVGNASYARGAQVRIARRLESQGLVTLRDDGNFKLDGRVDGERWYVEPTELGRAIATHG